MSGIDIPPPLDEPGLEPEAVPAVGVEMGVLKLAEVTNERKLSNCLNDRALCKVSRGRIFGIPMENPENWHYTFNFLYQSLSDVH